MVHPFNFQLGHGGYLLRFLIHLACHCWTFDTELGRTFNAELVWTFDAQLIWAFIHPLHQELGEIPRVIEGLACFLMLGMFIAMFMAFIFIAFMANACMASLFSILFFLGLFVSLATTWSPASMYWRS